MRRIFFFTALAIAISLAAVATRSAAAIQTPVCDGAPLTRLILHERGRVSIGDPRPLNVRQAAGTANPVIAQIPASGVFYVLDGPVCSQLYAWYQIDYNGITGWIAEGDDTAYYTEVYPPGW